MSERPLSTLTETIYECSLQRISKVFGVPVETLSLEARFGVELVTGPSSFWHENAFDVIDADIRDVADFSLRRKMAKGVYEISTVGDYCSHMVRCYKTRPRVVRKILGL